MRLGEYGGEILRSNKENPCLCRVETGAPHQSGKGIADKAAAVLITEAGPRRFDGFRVGSESRLCTSSGIHALLRCCQKRPLIIGVSRWYELFGFRTVAATLRYGVAVATVTPRSHLYADGSKVSSLNAAGCPHIETIDVMINEPFAVVD